MPPTLPARTDDLSIGDLAAATDVSRDGLRFYEARGLIRARRRSNGYRAYPPETVELVRYVRTAQQLGFTLAEIGEGMDLVWQQPDTDAAVTALLREKLSSIDARIASLQAMRDALATRLGLPCPLAPT
ncbi:MerR family transcriptional regulator [Ralstonia insidiosa]|jgi:MerR family copper efflux transcriptional regulator|uniref:MerR family transcriptional regulator n=1 Tax=Ralstonia TaxID=48736 RepID=UPI0015F7E368|nr:MerR family transcriptional regulator [Ralstonia insidiosa]MBX3771600.1 MerR family transcriptional regulator [Ralstonia pickettii]NPA01814.1 MerR family transcriptional regulator [Betaproteobacteria bacterium]MBA9858576.1 MerR family transcriptional regulator [Ralstonia insidiosa]MBA9871766.1 MerR family transcriptional regulator [Ralstonia insidiosa]MBA9912254.1 MerR family transcriptional regulator [Ralstonia insidiosa]